jgi:hypothetical protein
MFEQLKNRLTIPKKEKYFFNNTNNDLKNQTDFNKRYHSQGKYEDNVE